MPTLIKFGAHHRGPLLTQLMDPDIQASLLPYRPEDVDLWVASILADPHAYVIDLDGLMIGGARLDNAALSYWLAAAYRGKGYATAIVNKLCRMAISSGLKQISAYVSSTNTPAQNVLSRCYFKQISDTTWIKYL